MKKNYVLLFFFSLVIGTTALAQKVRYVKPGGTGNGSSWANASGDLQDMINASAAHEQVWVQKGIYKPNKRPDIIYDSEESGNVTPNDRFNSFLLKANVSVFGGFAGDEDSDFDLATRDFVANETILSGDIGEESVAEDNTYHVVTIAGEMGIRTIFDGFTIEGGQTEATSGTSNAIVVNNQTVPSTRAPGIAVYFVNFIELRNLVIRDNVNAATGQNAGAIYMFNGSGNLRNIDFLNNKAQGGSGGAVYTYGTSNIPADINFYNVKFVGNEANSGGGGLYMGSYSNLKLYDCSFVGNKTVVGSGGAFYLGSSTSTVEFNNTDFTSNVSETNGGAISAPNSGRMNINGGVFRDNNSTTNNSGGALYASASGLVLNIKGTEFRENKTLTASGGAMYLRGGTYVLEDCLFIGNESAATSGAVYINVTTLASHKFINCEFRDNISTTGGGASYVTGPDVEFISCRFINNISGSSGGALSFNGTNNMLTVVNSLFHGNQTHTTGSAGGGGAIYFYAGTNGKLINNSFVANKTTTSGRPGGLLYLAGTNKVSLLNSLSYLNTAANASAPDRNELYVPASSTVTIKNTLMQYYGTNGVNGNIVGQNPLFLSTTYGDANFMEVAAGSPIIDKGINADVPVALDLDALGKGRVHNGIIDMGAVEYLGAAVIAATRFTIDENLLAGKGLGDSNTINEVLIPISNTPNISLQGTITNWAIIAGNDAGAFVIDPSNGEITVADSAPLNYEVTKQFILTVALTNGLDKQKVTVIVDLNNLVEAPEKPIIDNIVHGNVVTTYRPTIRGVAEPNSIVKFFVNGQLYPVTTQADESGQYFFRFPTELPAGITEFIATDDSELFLSVPTIVNLKLYGGGTAGLIPTNILTPNGDGKNDVWTIENLAVMYPNHEIVVYDKVGTVVFKWSSKVSGPYDSDNANGNAWNGTFNGAPLNTGTYYYDINIGAGVDRIKGTVTILRGR